MSKQWRERLTELMVQRGFNMKSLSRAAGFGETFVRDILKRSQSPGIDKMKAIADTLGTSVEWLLGEEVGQLEELQVVPLDEQNGNGYHDGWRSRLPGGSAEVDARAGAGDGASGCVLTLDSGGIQSGHLVTAEWVVPRNHLGANPARVIFLPVVGTSMLPALNPTDVVAVDTSVCEIRDAEIYVIDEGDGPSVKRLRLNYDDDPRTISILSENPAVPPKKRPADLVRVIGLVIGRWSKM